MRVPRAASMPRTLVRRGAGYVVTGCVPVRRHVVGRARSITSAQVMVWGLYSLPLGPGLVGGLALVRCRRIVRVEL